MKSTKHFSLFNQTLFTQCMILDITDIDITKQEKQLPGHKKQLYKI